MPRPSTAAATGASTDPPTSNNEHADEVSRLENEKQVLTEQLQYALQTNKQQRRDFDDEHMSLQGNFQRQKANLKDELESTKNALAEMEAKYLYEKECWEKVEQSGENEEQDRDNEQQSLEDEEQNRDSESDSDDGTVPNTRALWKKRTAAKNKLMAKQEVKTRKKESTVTVESDWGQRLRARKPVDYAPQEQKTSVFNLDKLPFELARAKREISDIKKRHAKEFQELEESFRNVPVNKNMTSAETVKLHQDMSQLKRDNSELGVRLEEKEREYRAKECLWLIKEKQVQNELKAKENGSAGAEQGLPQNTPAIPRPRESRMIPKELVELRQEMPQLREVNQKLEAQAHEITKMLADKEREWSLKEEGHQRALAEKNYQLLEAQNNMKSYQLTIESLKEELGSKKRKRSQAESETQSLNNTLQKQLADRDHELASLRAEAQASQRRNDKDTADLKRRLSALDQRNKGNSRAITKTATLETELRHLRNKTKEKDDVIKDREAHIAHLGRQLNRADESIKNRDRYIATVREDYRLRGRPVLIPNKGFEFGIFKR